MPIQMIDVLITSVVYICKSISIQYCRCRRKVRILYCKMSKLEYMQNKIFIIMVFKQGLHCSVQKCIWVNKIEISESILMKYRRYHRDRNYIVTWTMCEFFPRHHIVSIPMISTIFHRYWCIYFNFINSRAFLHCARSNLDIVSI